ncbi:MAG: hypothetical protein KF693_14885, partial [Nitrospira sp.]|nr:hypothetical protein [Nitrospira sp.]
MPDLPVKPVRAVLGGCAVMLLAAVLPLWARADAVVEVAKFSRATVGQSVPDGWKPLTFKKIPAQTKYEVINDGDVT